MYHQPLHNFCTSSQHTISLNQYNLLVNYSELHNEQTVEFPHSHPNMYEFYYVTKGAIEHKVNGTLLTVPEGHFIFVNQGIQHETMYHPEQSCDYLTIVFSFQKRSTQNYTNGTEDFETIHLEYFFKYVIDKPFIFAEDHYHCERYIKDMYHEFDAKEWGWSYKLQSLFTCFIFDCTRNFIPPINEKIQAPTGNLPIAFTKYLHANYANPNLSLQDIADHFFISPRHVNRLFKEFFGASVSKTLTQYRIHYAKNFLMDTDYSVDEIAEQIGFSSGSTLSKLFKELEHMTISEFRYQYKQKMQQEAAKK